MKKITLALFLVTTSLNAYAEAPSNIFTNEVLVANKATYKPTVAQEGAFINGWGIAIRPAGKGGHFWVTAKDISYEYIGDVRASADEKIRKLTTDDLKQVRLPVGGPENFATGVVFNDSKKHFTITQQLKNGELITAPAKFLFASDGGIISAWLERKNADGSFDRPGEALEIIDGSKDGSQFFGLAISEDYDRLYAADFGAKPAIRVYDGKFKPEDITFDMPFDDNKNGMVDPGEYAPFNIHAFGDRIFVTYAKTQACPAVEVQKNTCKPGELFVGEEDTSIPGNGRVAEFEEDGELERVWNDSGKLSAPWGLAIAPKNFGPFGGALLVANFGDGTIAAFDPKTHNFIDVLRDANGKPIVIDKIWGLMFGNGESLGDSDALYYAAGPNDEKDGTFGVIRFTK